MATKKEKTSGGAANPIQRATRYVLTGTERARQYVASGAEQARGWIRRVDARSLLAKVALAIAIIAAANLGLVGIAGLDLVQLVFGPASQLVYGIVGVAAVAAVALTPWGARLGGAADRRLLAAPEPASKSA